MILSLLYGLLRLRTITRNYQIIMKKEKIFPILLFIAIIVVQAQQDRNLQATSYAITASRSTQLSNMCTNTDRTTLYNNYGLSGNVNYTSQFSKFYNLDSTIFNLFLNLDVIGINNNLKTNTIGYATYVVPAFVGPAILIFIIPFLLTCLCCPSRCCLRKKLLYSKCQQIWPAVFAMILCTLVVGTCFAGIFTDYKMYKGYQQLSCSGIIVVDDALYGSKSSSGQTFFSGMKTINYQLKTLNGTTYNNIIGNLSSLSSNGNSTNQALNLMSNSLYSISVIPDSSTNNLILNYNTPIISATPNSTVSSTLPTILGSKNDNSSLVGTAYSSMNNAYSNLSATTSTVDSFISSSSAFLTSISQISNQTSQSASSLKSTLLTVNDMLVTQNYSQKIYYIEGLFYGIILGLVVLFLLSLIIFICCDKISCRYFLYILGFFIFLLAVASFAVFFFLTYASAIFSSGCNYFAETINNPSTFITNVKKIGISQNVATEYSVCLKGQDGRIVGKLSGQQNENYLNSLKYVMTNITSFNGGYLSNSINSGYSKLNTTLPNYLNSNTIDITDSNSIDSLNYIADSKNYVCTDSGFTFDSWIPTINQTNNAIPCKSPSGMPNSDNQTCKSTTDFNSGGTGCQGCMGTYSLLYNAISQANVISILQGRYPNCSNFNTQLANIWQNYYLIKKNTLESVGSRELTARQSVSTVTNAISKNLVPTFENTINKLYSTSPFILTPNYGILWGLDCTVIGEDLVLFQEVACKNTFSYSYYHRIMCCIIGFALTALLCCCSCTIFRKRREILLVSYPPEDKKAKAMPYQSPLSDFRLQDRI